MALSSSAEPKYENQSVQNQGDHEQVRREIGTVVITDVYGFTKAANEAEEKTLQRVTKDLEAFQEICERRGGTVLVHRGDGLKMLFSSAIEAVNATLEMQKHAFKQNAKADSKGMRIRHRMGVHVGEIARLGNTVTGTAVAVCARLEQVCYPGKIAMSEEIYKMVAPELKVRTVYAGHQNLKNVPYSFGVRVAWVDCDLEDDESAVRALVNRTSENRTAADQKTKAHLEREELYKQTRREYALRGFLTGLGVLFLVGVVVACSWYLLSFM